MYFYDQAVVWRKYHDKIGHDKRDIKTLKDFEKGKHKNLMPYKTDFCEESEPPHPKADF